MTQNNGKGIVWVLWDGDNTPKSMHEESLTAKGQTKETGGIDY